jgi:hypothetical protein
VFDFDSDYGASADVARLHDEPAETLPTTFVGNSRLTITWVRLHGFPCRQDGPGGPLVVTIPYTHPQMGDGTTDFVCGDLAAVREALGY